MIIVVRYAPLARALSRLTGRFVPYSFVMGMGLESNVPAGVFCAAIRYAASYGFGVACFTKKNSFVHEPAPTP